MVLNLRNNLRDSISSISATVNAKAATCQATSLAAGQTTSCPVALVTTCDAGDAYSFDVSVTYTDSATGASYTFTGEGQKLEGKCAT